MMDHVMVDLETLGTSAGCVVLSIGAVGFDPVARRLGPSFHFKINVEDSEKHGLRVDQATVDWWEKQSEAARMLLAETRDIITSHRLDEALDNFSEWVRLNFPNNPKLWGNGADFDNPILKALYTATERKFPFSSWNGRCYRTIKSLAPHVKLKREGTYHSALDDAISQTKHLFEVLDAVNITLS